MIIAAIARMVDGILAAAVGVALQQAQLTEQARMIGQADQVAREQRQAFQINRALVQLALDVRDTGFGPSR
jgi:hypothetical protein